MSKLYVQMESVQQPKKPLLRLLPRHGTNAFLSDGGLFLFCCRNASQEKKAHLLPELLWRRVSMTVKQMLEYWCRFPNKSQKVPRTRKKPKKTTKSKKTQIKSRPFSVTLSDDLKSRLFFCFWSSNENWWF